MGFFNAVLTKFTHIRQHVDLETALFTLMSYTTFLAAETVGASGIVAVLLCGICQAHYTYKNLSNESKIQTKQVNHYFFILSTCSHISQITLIFYELFFEKLFYLLSFLSENLIFVYIGVTLLTIRESNWNTWFIITAFVAIFVGRLLNVYPLSFLINLTRTTRRKITFSMQNMLFFSGLRGAMAFSLGKYFCFVVKKKNSTSIPKPKT
jgi:sodium/hydrogen exchanger-like protein 6/7